jgi:hypothetical protein
MELISRTKPGRRVETMVERLWGFYKVDYAQFSSDEVEFEEIEEEYYHY